MSSKHAQSHAALLYATQGWPVLLCIPGEKRPATRHGFKDATTNREELIAALKKVPEANLGIATGAVSGLVVLDVDPRNGGTESLRELEQIHGPLPETLTVETGGGGIHFYYRIPPNKKVKGFVLAPGLDVKGDGGYVVAPPSKHPNGPDYKWTSDPRNTVIAEAPPCLLENPSKRKQASEKAAPPSDAADTPLGRLFAECDFLGKSLESGKRAVICPWQGEHTTGAPFDSSTVLFPASGDGPGGFHCSHSHCVGRSVREVFDCLRRKRDANNVERSWMNELKRDKHGVPKSTLRNLCLILQNDPTYGRLLRFNEMSSAVLLGDEEMRDAGISAIRIDIDRRYGITAGEADVVRAVQYVAELNRFHPVRTFLMDLRWDGTPRLDRVAQEILGARAETEEMAKLLAIMIRKWFIALVARPLKPGIKVDVVLILVGSQGAGKSTFYKVLGGEWFTDTEMALDKDGLMQLCGSWILEWAELENMFGRNTTSRIKQFVTSDRDKFRPPFGRVPITVLRTSLIVGSTNLDSFLHDPTGSRRFWAVPSGIINLPLLREWREQLLAEAVVAYQASEHHWLSEPEEELRQAFVAQYNETDPWEETVLRYAEVQPTIRISEVLAGPLHIPVERQTRREEQRVAAILRRNGWYPDQRKVEGRNVRLWRRRGNE